MWEVCRHHVVVVALVAAFLLPQLACSFYLPGIAPVDYEEGGEIAVYANKVTSPTIKVPFGYYSIPACPPPTERVRSRHRNLGQILSGERSDFTSFKFNMKVNEYCKELCVRTLYKEESLRWKRLIQKDYRVRLNVDNMPVVVEGQTAIGQRAFQLGYPLGAELNGETYIYNHLQFTVLYHKPEFSSEDLSIQATDRPVYRIVGFKVVPASAKKCPTSKDGKPAEGNATKTELQKLEQAAIRFTYDVIFEESQIKWATRWDPLLAPSPEQKQVQWFSIMNSIMVTVFLSGIVALVLLRTIHQDFMRYNQLEDEEELQDESGWKLVHGDVFRPPPYPALFAVLNGTGAQVLTLMLLTIFFAAGGFLSPANRGGMLTGALLAWIFTSVVSGYVSARVFSTLGGTEKRAVSIGSILGLPGASFTVFFIINFVIWVNGASNAVPFFTLILLLLMWFGLSAPLTLFGAYMGYNTKPYEHPCRTNNIPREVPPPPFGIPPLAYSVVTGLMPFGVVFIELVFILSSLWQNQMFYMFGFLFLVFCLMMVTCCEVAIVFTYMKLSTEDYRWWWHSFIYTAASSVYVFGYSVFFLITQTEVNPVMNIVTSLIFFGYMGLISVGFGLMTGFVGFWSSYWFVRRIYSSIRID